MLCAISRYIGWSFITVMLDDILFNLWIQEGFHCNICHVTLSNRILGFVFECRILHARYIYYQIRKPLSLGVMIRLFDHNACTWRTRGILHPYIHFLSHISGIGVSCKDNSIIWMDQVVSWVKLFHLSDKFPICTREKKITWQKQSHNSNTSNILQLYAYAESH